MKTFAVALAAVRHSASSKGTFVLILTHQILVRDTELCPLKTTVGSTRCDALLSIKDKIVEEDPDSHVDN